MPNSIGEAIQKKHRLTPINLSYVVPLLSERNLVRAFKEGRNWYVEAVQNAPEDAPAKPTIMWLEIRECP